MKSTVEHLVQLGLREYEARVYVALAGLGEAPVRRIHEVSGVPRPRVYDILNGLDQKGFIEIRRGSPLLYRAVPPEVVVTVLKKDLDAAAAESVRALKALSVDAQQDYSPIWYVHSDWTIQRNLEMLVEGVDRELIVLALRPEGLAAVHGPIASIAGDRDVKVLVPGGGAADVAPRDGVRYFEAGRPRDLFEEDIFERIFSVPISREGAVFRLECILVADDRESMLVYAQDGRRMAVVITLPFITCVQSRLFSRMIEHARELVPGVTRTGD